ncbi:MAG: DUF4325 domain-containing protein [Proteobacteria bacterium]|nr:DUF4325 domain-containing protein [Pseudomonadota bacterium]MCL2308424.1 DUF4325 domain-containing protein [Pseudomonadota bacterium]
MARPKINPLDGMTWLTKRVADQPRGLAKDFAVAFGVSRMAATTFIRERVEAGFFIREGSDTRPTYFPGPRRFLRHRYPMPNIDESQIWLKDFFPYLQPLPQNLEDICHYGFTEMLNNANDHSEGNEVVATAYKDEKIIFLAIEDNGVGIFEKITHALQLPDKRFALLELGKGKFTTDQSNHSGEGIFFTSRMFDRFVIRANGLTFKHDDQAPLDILSEDDIVLGQDDFGGRGTSVCMIVAENSQRTSREVFDRFTLDDEELNFDKTIVPVKLARVGSENLISRSQAKRLLNRLDRFKHIELDFSGIDMIGQAFADEVFRVFKNNHPDISLKPVNTSDEVRKMIGRVNSAMKR